MKFSYSAVWDDTLRLVREHGALLAAIAGVFIFLPSLLLGYLLPAPESVSTDANEAFQMAMDYYRGNLHWFLLVGVIAMWGSLAVLRLIFPRQATVAGAITAAAALLPFYFLVSLISGFIVGIGFLLLILPGLYLWGRLLPAAPAMVAEERRNPLDALKRGWELSEGHGWLIIGLYLLVAIPAGIMMLVIAQLTGIVFILATGQQFGTLLGMIVLCAMQALVSALLTMLAAAVYRALAPRKPEL